MKKALVLILILSGIFVLAGCQDQDTKAPVITGAVDLTYVIGDDIPDLTDGITVIDDIDQEITLSIKDDDVNYDVAGVYEITYSAKDSAGNQSEVTVYITVLDPDLEQILVLIKNIDDTIALFESIPFESNDIPIIDLIETEVDIDYTSYDFGLLINGVGNIYPPEYGASYNYYFQILKDGNPITSSLDEQTYDNGTTFTFQITTTLSDFDLTVDRFIYDHLDLYQETYINDGAVDYNVLTAFYKLNQNGYIALDPTTLYDYTTLDIMSSNYEDLSIAELLKLSIYMKVDMLDTTSLETHVQTRTATDPYSLSNLLTLYYVLGLENQTFAETLIAEDFSDADMVGMSYQALMTYTDIINYNDYIASSTTYITDHLTSDGVSSWGNANASSTAQVIIGLLHQGFDPQSEMFQVDGEGLIEKLFLYELDGLFKWGLTNEQADQVFTSPQVFSALVLYKLARDAYGFPPTSLYLIN